MSVASLDAPRWNASEVVLLDIGTFMQLPPRVHAKTPRCCNQPAPTSAMHAVFRFAGLASAFGSRQTKNHALARAVLLCFSGRFYPRFSSRHGDLLRFACLSRASNMLATVMRAPC